ncbi:MULTISPECIES: ABC transporter substrate-binding protein [unclassified Leifsonia]|uniref:ABC transporter substrate-binding protein n=1 Tax=unclassified Leifsonia TaxID=2663824 RepID=UPI0006F1E339|nr:MULTISPECIES: extracellular solute-binding protein [unclassified Leifsonia]KQX08219.1 sugar ABC transporter substrate-binding protein [Leifsonia sp. Root1293]KRA12501.1 sugar ABC transporter substrate-binding protein [Leifsonia sp. Root60]
MHAQKVTAITAVVAAAAIALSGCSGGTAAPAADVTAEPEYSGTLSILTKFGGDPLGPYFENLGKAYEELHPDVKVELIQETDQSVKDKTKTLTASGALPDIYFTWTGNWAENFVRGGLAADLSDVIAPDTEWGKSFGEASLDAFAFDDKYYGIPLYNNGKFMGYNKAIFEEAGVDVPTSFDELIDSCAPIRAAGYEPIAFGNKDGWPALHYLQQLFAYNVPTDVLHADFAPATAKLDDPGYITALEQFKQLVDECTDTGNGTNGVLYTTAQEALAGGTAAMYYQEILEFDTVTAEGNTLTPDDFGIFQLPAPADAAGDADAIEGAPEGYLVNAKSPRAALAVDFMKFATTLESATTLSSPPYGQPSTVIGAVTPDTSSVAVFDGITQVNEASQIVIWLDTVTVPEVADAWLAGGEALISGSSTPEQVLESVRAASNSAK